MKISGADFVKTQAKNFVLEQAATAAINAALTVMGNAGYDTSLLRAKLHDGSAIRTLLQDNDIDTATNLGGGSASNSKIPSQAAVKAYVDAVASSGAQPYTAFDASTNTTFPSGATLTSRYRVTVAGTLTGAGNVVLQVGDTLQPAVASPSTTSAADWIVLQGNVDAASNTVLGMMLLATLAQLTGNAGGDANRAVTVSVFNQFEAANPRVKSFESTGNNLVAGTNAITHNLNSTKLVVQLRDGSGPVLADWTTNGANGINISSLAALSGVTVSIIALP